MDGDNVRVLPVDAKRMQLSEEVPDSISCIGWFRNDLDSDSSLNQLFGRPEDGRETALTNQFLDPVFVK